MLREELFYSIALSLVPRVGDIHARALIDHFGSAEAVFKVSRSELEKLPGIGSVRAKAIRSRSSFHRAEAEIRFLDKFRIRAYVYPGIEYPKRLIPCPDAPIVLYYKGHEDLHRPRFLSVVGTRNPTDYGKELTRELMALLSPYQPVIVSGLAYGIDTLAHRHALKQGLTTIGVLAHGLDRIYPAENKQLAREMTERGGLLTDFISGADPDPQHFVKRNRIVAGLSDAVIVVETGVKGGSMITADLANGYHKDVFTFPGRISDTRSQGCNALVSEQKAQLLTSPDELIRFLNWTDKPRNHQPLQRRLFTELSATERLIAELIGQHGPVPIDSLKMMSELRYSELATITLRLEMLGLIQTLPGKSFALIP